MPPVPPHHMDALNALRIRGASMRQCAHRPICVRASQVLPTAAHTDPAAPVQSRGLLQGLTKDQLTNLLVRHQICLELPL